MKNISGMDKLFTIVNTLLILADIFILNPVSVNYLNNKGYADLIIVVLMIAVINYIFILMNMLRVNVKGDRLFAYGNVILVSFSLLFLNISFVTIVLFPTTVQGVIIFVRRVKKIDYTRS